MDLRVIKMVNSVGEAGLGQEWGNKFSFGHFSMRFIANFQVEMLYTQMDVRV